MEFNGYLLLAISFICVVALVGFFYSKTKGFGPFATSAMLLILIISIISLLYASGRLAELHFVNIIFAIIGFAGGLFTRGSYQINRKEKPPTT